MVINERVIFFNYLDWGAAPQIVLWTKKCLGTNLDSL